MKNSPPPKTPLRIKDIAKKAGVNASTVSRALANSTKISVDVRKKIQKIAGKMGYVKNLSAYMLKTKKSLFLDIVIPSFNYFSSDFYSAIFIGIEQVVTKTDYSLSFTSLEEQNIIQDKILQGRVDGIFIIGDVYSSRQINAFMKLDTEKVFISVPLASNKKNAVSIAPAFAAGTEILTTRLIAEGSKSILFISGGSKFVSSGMKIEGMQKAAKKAGVKTAVVYGDFGKGPNSAREIIQELIAKGTFFYDAIICDNDDLALGVLSALSAAGKKYGRTLVAGHDASKLCNYSVVPFYSVDYQCQALGRRGAAKLLSGIDPSISVDIPAVPPPALFQSKNLLSK